MTLKSLEYFLQAAEDMNITEAARKLYITQQTLSGHIKRLEETYHVSLFHRKPQLSLTSEGVRMVKYARHILQLERTMRSELAEINRHAEGSLSFGISRMRAKYFYPAIWRQYEQEFPNIKVNLQHKDSDHLIPAVESHEIDSCVAVNASVPPQIICETLMRENLYAAVGKTVFRQRFGSRYLQCLREFSNGIIPAQLSGIPVMYTDNNRFQRIVESSFDAHAFVPETVLTSKEQELLFRMAKAGRGTAYISPLCIFLNDSDLSDVLKDVYVFPVNDMIVTTHLLFPDEEEIPHYKKQFICICKNVFARISDELDKAYMAAYRLQSGEKE